MIVEELMAIQHRLGFLPAEELRAISARINVPLYRLYAVASFFPHFRLTPPAPVEVRVCADMSCHLHGASRLQRSLEAIAKQMGAETVDVKEVSCLGQCDGAPAASINDQIYGSMTEQAMRSLITSAAAGNRLQRVRTATSARGLRSDPYTDGSRYGALRRIVQTRDFAGTIAALKASDLRGMGGAGFSTALKWELVRNASGDEKYIVCNADESEPGTIKDREIMQTIPHLMIEGMAIAGVAVGARKGIIYIRHEYDLEREIIEQALDAAQREGVIGKAILGSDLSFDLEIFVSPGGYICGEETALLEVIEGKRAEPRNKPPFPVTHGLHNKPTVINNVETFAFVPVILMKGANWFKAQGQHGASGLKFIGVSGHVRHPGVFEVPMGISASEVIFRLAGGLPEGRTLKAFAPSGASSGFLPASMVDVPLDFKSLAQVGSMLGSGAIVVMAQGTCMVDMALNVAKFFRNESCGKCVPCRVGSQKIVDILTGITHGTGSGQDLDVIEGLEETLLLTSICGLGQVVPNPIKSVITYFKDEVDDHIARKRCVSGMCFS